MRSTDAGQPRTRGWATVVGVGVYEDDEAYGPLPCCIKDAIGMYFFLTHPRYTNLKPEHVNILLDGSEADIRNAVQAVSEQLQERFKIEPRKHLVDEIVKKRKEPTRANVLTWVSQAAQNANQQEDLLLIYFALHGHYFNDDVFLVSQDAKQTVIQETAIPLRSVKALMNLSLSARRVLLLDACYSGSPVKMTKSIARPRMKDALLSSTGDVAILASSLPWQLALEADILGHGAFTFFLLEGLSGKAAAGRNGCVTLRDISDYAAEETKTWVASTSKRGHVQTPTLNEVGRRLGRHIALSGTIAERTHLGGLSRRERALLVGMAACADRCFWLPLAIGIAGESIEDSGTIVHRLLDRSALLTVDSGRGLYRLEPPVRAELLRSPRIRTMRQLHVDHLTGYLSGKGRCRDRRVLVEEVLHAMDWLCEIGQLGALEEIAKLACKAMDTSMAPERQALRVLQTWSPPAPLPKNGIRRGEVARWVLSRYRWCHLRVHDRADGQVHEALHALGDVEKLHRAKNTWLKQACYGIRAHLALADPDTDVEAARECLRSRHEICHARGFADLMWCIGDQVVLSFIGKSIDGIAEDAERQIREREIDDKEIAEAAALLEKQARVAAKLGRTEWRPSMLGNLTDFHLAVDWWRSNPHMRASVSERDSPGGLPQTAPRREFVFTFYWLAVVLRLIRPRLAGRANRQSNESKVRTMLNAARAGGWRIERERHAIEPTRAPYDAAASRTHWAERGHTHHQSDIPDQHGRFLVVRDRLVRAWATSEEAGGLLDRYEQRLEDGVGGEDGDDMTDTVVTILRYRDRYVEALEHLERQEKTQVARRDGISLLSCLARQGEIISTAIESWDDRTRWQAGGEGKPSKTLRELRSDKDRVDAAFSAWSWRVTFQWVLAYRMWTWALLAGCSHQNEDERIVGVRRAKRYLDRVGELLRELHLGEEAAELADADMEKLNKLSKLTSSTPKPCNRPTATRPREGVRG